MACKTPGIPENLHKKNRLPVQDFSSDNNLFIRVPKKYFEEGARNGMFSVNAFTLDKQSTNRDRYSNHLDVLYNINAISIKEHYDDWGIVSLGINELSSKQFTHPEEGYLVNAYPRHQPEECMYPHTEIWFRKKDNYDAAIKSRKLKSMIRAHYLDIAMIVKYPDT